MINFNISNFDAVTEIEFSNYECQHLQKNIARRMNKLTKIALDSSLKCIQSTPIDYIVHATRFGEIDNFYEMSKILARKESPSPTAFSQSTQNSIVGNFSIVYKRNIPTTSISACESTFSTALEMAIINLHAKNLSNLLFIYSEPELISFYKKKISATRPIVFTAVLNKENEFSYNKMDKTNDENQNSIEVEQIINFIKNKNKNYINCNNYQIIKR